MILDPLPTARSGLTASVLSGAVFVFGGESTLKTFEENEAYVPEEGWFPQQPIPISRHGLSSATVENNIYVIGGGVDPGFSFSGITEAYHNTVTPEFGAIVYINEATGKALKPGELTGEQQGTYVTAGIIIAIIAAGIGIAISRRKSLPFRRQKGQ